MSDDSKRQQITRIPSYRPGDLVKIKSFGPADADPASLSGKVRRVKSLTCSITAPDQKIAVWRVHFDDGRCLTCDFIKGLARPEEIKSILYRK